MAELLRQIVPTLPAHLKADARQYMFDFLSSLPEPYEFKKIVMSFTGKNREELQRFAAVSDAIVSFGSIDPEAALNQIQQIAFSEFLDEKFILETKTIYNLLNPYVSGLNPDSKEARKKFAKSFFQDLVRLDLALSLRDQSPEITLVILDSLKNDFWIGLSYTALRRGLPEVTGFDPKIVTNPESFKSRLRKLLREAKMQWLGIEVAELLDRAAMAVYIKEESAREEWLSYLPFALTIAGQVLYAKDSTAAMNVFQKTISLAKEIPTPTREWALCWNAAVFSKTNFQKAFISATEATNLITVLGKHGPWESSIPLLVNQVAAFNPEAALNIARSLKDKPTKVQAMVEVVNGMNI